MMAATVVAGADDDDNDVEFVTSFSRLLSPASGVIVAVVAVVLLVVVSLFSTDFADEDALRFLHQRIVMAADRRVGTDRTTKIVFKRLAIKRTAQADRGLWQQDRVCSQRPFRTVLTHSLSHDKKQQTSSEKEKRHETQE